MIQLPQSTIVNSIVFKNKFKDYITNKQIEYNFNEIKQIVWKNKLSEESLAINKTSTVIEIEIFEIKLKSKSVPKFALDAIDRAIPYPILFILTYENDFKYYLNYKLNRKIINKYELEWNEMRKFDISGKDLEFVYQKMIGVFINETISTNNFIEIVEKDKLIKELSDKICTMKIKRNRETQFHKKVEINKQINDLKHKLEEIKNEEN